MNDSWETLGEVARQSRSSEGTVRRYAARKLIECRRDPYGRRIFPPGTGMKLAALRAEREKRLISANAS